MIRRRFMTHGWHWAMLTIAVVGWPLYGGLLAQAVSTTNPDGSPAWAKPMAVAIKRLGATSAGLNQPNFQSNLDCTSITYRQVRSTDMQTGCFMATAYGLVNPDNEMVIFNGTDEALPLLPYSPHQVLTPWPGTVDTLTLDSTLTGGSYLGLYRNLLPQLQDQRDALARLTAKVVASPPDIMLRNTDGTNLVVNPQTMAFSTGSSWLIVESLSGAFLRINLATLDNLAFAPAFGSQGSPALLKSQVTVSDDGRFVAIENNVAGSFRVYDLAACQGETSTVNPLTCANHDYWPIVNSQLGGLKGLSHLRFINRGLLSFTADYTDGAATFELAPRAEISSLINYLAVGDSYTSGEGAYDYLTGTDTSDNNCHLSLHSYPLLLTQQFYGGSGGHSVACSGARSADLLPQNYEKYAGQARDSLSFDRLTTGQADNILASFTPGNLPQANFVSHYQPGILTVSIGGNDIGFGDLLQNCVMPRLSRHLSDGVCYNTYEDRLELVRLIDRTVPHWTSLFRRLQTQSPSSRIYVIGYPQIAYDKGSCALNVQLSKSELEFSAEIISYLNGALQQAAAASGANYVDVSEALFGYRLCETASYNVAVNGLTAGNDSGVFGLKVFGRESYHPNAFGQALIAAAILKQTDKLRTVSPTGVISNPSQGLLNVPQSGRQILTLIPGHGFSPPVIARGATGNLYVDGAANSLKPGSPYRLSLDRTASSTIATVTADHNGNLATSFNLPETIAPGNHTIDLSGVDQSGQVIDISEPLYVPASDDDADGDGIANVTDSCPGAVNSGQDSDQDGIDDICDAYIGQLTPPSDDSRSASSSLSDDHGQTPVPTLIAASNDHRATPNQLPPTNSADNLATPTATLKIDDQVGVVSPQSIIKSYAVRKNPLSATALALNYRLTLGNWLVWTTRLSLLWLLLLASLWGLRRSWLAVRRRFRLNDRRATGRGVYSVLG